MAEGWPVDGKERAGCDGVIGEHVPSLIQGRGRLSSLFIYIYLLSYRFLKMEGNLEIIAFNPIVSQLR